MLPRDFANAECGARGAGGTSGRDGRKRPAWKGTRSKEVGRAGDDQKSHTACAHVYHTELRRGMSSTVFNCIDAFQIGAVQKPPLAKECKSCKSRTTLMRLLSLSELFKQPRTSPPKCLGSRGQIEICGALTDPHSVEAGLPPRLRLRTPISRPR